jgi:hypothetical protein
MCKHLHCASRGIVIRLPPFVARKSAKRIVNYSLFNTYAANRQILRSSHNCAGWLLFAQQGHLRRTQCRCRQIPSQAQEVGICRSLLSKRGAGWSFVAECQTNGGPRANGGATRSHLSVRVASGMALSARTCPFWSLAAKRCPVARSYMPTRRRYSPGGAPSRSLNS